MSTLYVLKTKEGEKGSPYDSLVKLAALYGNVNVEIKETEKEFRQTDEYKKIHPHGSCPALQTKQGSLFESQAIAKFLVEKDSKLRGTGFHAAQVDQLIDFFVGATSDAAHRVIVDLHHGNKPNKADLKLATPQFEKVTGFLNSLLVENTFLLGHYITLADIAIANAMVVLFEKHFEPEFLDTVKSLRRWFKTMAAQPHFKTVLGEIKLKEKKTKTIDSKFNLEEWKRIYMNSKPEEAIEYFWKNLDPRANSVWVADYKYSSDFTEDPLYKTANLMSGQSQRAQPFAKFTFGILTIVGEDPGQKHIKCCWVYESTKFPEQIQKESIDYDMFDWKRADWKKDKELIDSFLTAEVIEGKKVLECKVFR
eukprot:gene9801-2126_t